jgi:hypothetical protein
MFEMPLGMQTDLSTELAAVFGAFTIHSPSAFSFAGEPPVDTRATQNPPAWNTPALPPPGDSSDTESLVRAVQGTLYDRCYARRLGGPAAPPSRMDAADPEFTRQLAQANAGRERWDKGWVIHQLGPNGQVFVRKGERERAAMPGAFISETVMGMAPQIGGSVSIRAPRESVDVQPGYYFAFGETLDELAEQLSLVRFYFHCSADSAVLLIGELTEALNRFQVPFQLKTPAIRTLYGRTDAAVLYTGARYVAITARIIAGLRHHVPLEPAVPLFTKPLWPGIGAAVEPGSGESFGMHRCRLAAEGIVDAWRNGSQDVPARFTAVAARFTAAGIDFARPYAGPDGVDLFDVPGLVQLP